MHHLLQLIRSLLKTKHSRLSRALARERLCFSYPYQKSSFQKQSIESLHERVIRSASDYMGLSRSCQIGDNQVTQGEDVGAEGVRFRPQMGHAKPNGKRFKNNKAACAALSMDLVEMAGIEPASEKFDLQMSTSLVDLFSFDSGRPDQLGQPALSDGPREGVSSRAHRRLRGARRHLCRLLSPGRRKDESRRVPCLGERLAFPRPL